MSTRDRLVSLALDMPGAWEDHPWGEVVAKVGKKVFVFFGMSEDFGFSVKLPVSADQALSFECCEPTGYGLGKAGWVTVRMSGRGRKPPVGLLEDWIEESYRAVAPKKLIAELDSRAAT